MGTKKKIHMNESAQRGFESGDYASAYETTDFWDAYDKHIHGKRRTEAYCDGFKLGFYATYELHEIPESDRASIARLREKWEE